MENLFAVHFSWADFFVAAILLWTLFFLLRFIAGFLSKTTFLKRYRIRVIKAIHAILLIYEPLVLLILSSIFVWINPAIHGSIMILLLLVNFNYLKSYITGRIIQLNNALSVGNRLSIQGVQGILSKVGRLGLHLKTSKGLQFFSYTHLFQEGFMMLSGEEIGGFYQLKITPSESMDKADYKERFLDLLITAPYLDRNFKPEVRQSGEFPETLNAKVAVKEENHLY